MRIFVVSLMLVLFSPALLLAQACGDMDCMGVYFDAQATIYTLYTSNSMQNVSAYLCISNPSESGGVGGWECKLTVEGSPVAPSWSYANNGLNIADGVNDGLFNVGVGLGSYAIQPVGNVILLATWTAFIPSTSDELRFFLSNYPGSITPELLDDPGYVSGANIKTVVPCGIHKADYTVDYTAHINVPDTRINEDATWSEVKKLYQQ